MAKDSIQYTWENAEFIAGAERVVAAFLKIHKSALANVQVVAELTEKSGKLQKHYDTLFATLENGDKVTAKFATNTKLASVSIKKLGDEAVETEAHLRAMARAQEAAIAMDLKRTAAMGNLKNLVGGGYDLNAAMLGQTKDTTRLNDQLGKIKSAFGELDGGINKAHKSAATFAFTWTNMLQLAGVQLAHQAISRLTMALYEGAKSAMELQIHIAEIQTISQGQQLSVGGWMTGARRTSDKFGLPMQDTVEALYQAISNQVVHGAASFTFMDEAAKLAMTTVASTTEAVNILSSVINAYGLRASQAGDISAVLFKSVELGRVRLNEMSDSIGRILLPAKQLGVNFTEVNALIDLFTIRGVTFEESMTYIRNVIMKLLKPTEEMGRFFRSIGVESGQAAIKAYGWAGVFQKMEAYAKGSSGEIASLFNNIRAVSPALLLLDGGLKDYNETLKKLTSAQGDYNKAVDIMLQNSGQKLKIEIQKMRNYFLVDLGNSILESTAKMTGGFEGLEAIMKMVANTAGFLLVPALISVTQKTLALLAGTNAAVAASKPYVGLFIVLATALAAIKVQYEGVEKDAVKLQHALDAANLENAKQMDKLRHDRTDALKAEYADQASIISQRVALVQAAYNAEVDAAAAAMKLTQEALENGIKDAMNLVHESMTKAEQHLREVENDIKSIQKDLEEAPIAAEKKAFAGEVDRENDPAAKVRMIGDRIAALQQQAKKYVEDDGSSRAITEKLYAEILDLHQKRMNLLDKEQDKNVTNAEKRQKLEGDLASQKIHYAKQEQEAKDRVAKTEDAASMNRLELENKYFKMQNNIRDVRDAIAQGKATPAEHRRLQEAVRDLAIFRKQAQQSNQQHEAEAAKAKADLAEMQRLQIKYIKDHEAALSKLNEKSVNANTLKGEANKLQEEYLKLLDTQLAKMKLIAAEEQKGKVEEKVRGSLLDQAAKKVGEFDLEKTLKEKDPKEIQRQLQTQVHATQSMLQLSGRMVGDTFQDELSFDTRMQLITRLAELEKLQTKQIEDMKRAEDKATFDQKMKNIDTLITEYTKKIDDIKTITSEVSGTAQSAMNQNQVEDWSDTIGGLVQAAPLYERLARGALSALPSDQIPKNLVQMSTQMGQTLMDTLLQTNIAARRGTLTHGTAGAARDTIRSYLTDVDPTSKKKELDPLRNFLAAITKIADDKNIDKTIGGLKDYQQALKILQDQATKGPLAVRSVAEEVEKLATKSKDAADVISTAIFAIQDAIDAKKAPALQTPAMGGYIGYFDRGGLVRGTDTIPAMLTPGEFVVNRNSTSKFFSQLVAMNAGMPATRNDNHSISVGDINVSVSGGSTSQQTIQDIAKGLNREIRRRTIKWSN